ncbi:MAG: hypothetical protein WC343_11110 [Bacilli bacterium]
MIDIAMCRRGNLFVPFSEEDRQSGLVFPENKILVAKITGATSPRSIRELRCYFGSCDYIASHDFNPNMNAKEKVDHLTRIECGFIKDTVFDARGFLHWIVEELKLEKCHQSKSHAFIVKALEKHAALCGIYDVDEYVRNLKQYQRM